MKSYGIYPSLSDLDRERSIMLNEIGWTPKVFFRKCFALFPMPIYGLHEQLGISHWTAGETGAGTEEYPDLVREPPCRVGGPSK